ncbi:hypothetical protein LPJ61_001874 [Coemansia biformis]|uniref:SH3 domain-containing protein n=1 Tax=Coemansia biformis TaxID=1286918 RepID=A0A9W7YGW3_9FUNG|nr:hypothetical protein LPJ61_001874 [Coemansia biformis]
MRSLAARLLAALVAAALTCSPSAHAECISLRDSQGCPGFAQEFVSTNATSRFSWYPKDDVSAFDKALSDYVTSRANLDEFQSVFRCSGLDDLGGFSSDHGLAVIRYHRSMICADVLFSDNNIRECYGENAAGHRRRDGVDKSPELQLAEVLASTTVAVRPSAPMALCRSTCESWIDSLHTIVANATLCQPDKGINREASLESLRSKCDLNMHSGAPGHCVDGNANELKTCGYQRVEDWCRYCSYAVDYADVCASVGVRVGNGESSDGDKSKHAPPTAPGDRGIEADGLIAELARRRHQERVLRVVVIVLGVLAGIVLVALLVMIAMGRSLPPFVDHGIHHTASRSGSSSGMDDSTLLQLGANGQGQPEKVSDFVDCFLTLVGKPRKVIYPFFARREDEISLQSGDTVTVQMAFDDGWVVGKNVTSGLEGTFPLMCIMDNLPPSMPSHWSVLPETKNASIDNMRSSSRSVTRATPRVSGATEGYCAGSPLPPHAPVITTTGIPTSPHLHSTRNSTRIYRRSSEERAQRDSGSGFLGRLLGALMLTNPASTSAGAGSATPAPGFFRRLIFSPPSTGSARGPLEISKPIPSRPHSFTVHSAVHVGLNNPGYMPAPGEQNTWVSTVPVGIPSANRYPIMNGHAPTGYNSTARSSTDRLPTAPGAPMQPSSGFGEFAPSNNSQLTVTGNPSLDTYRTAEQSASGAPGQALASATAATYFR